MTDAPGTRSYIPPSKEAALQQECDKWEKDYIELHQAVSDFCNDGGVKENLDGLDVYDAMVALL